MLDGIIEKNCDVCGKTFIARPNHAFKIRKEGKIYKWFCLESCKKHYEHKQEIKYYLLLIKRMEQEYINYEERKPRDFYYYNERLSNVGSKIYCKYFRKIDGLEILASAGIEIKEQVLEALKKVEKHLKNC